MVPSAPIAQMALAGISTGSVPDSSDHCIHLDGISLAVVAHANSGRSQLVPSQAENVHHDDCTSNDRLCFTAH